MRFPSEGFRLSTLSCTIVCVHMKISFGFYDCVFKKQPDTKVGRGVVDNSTESLDGMMGHSTCQLWNLEH